MGIVTLKKLIKPSAGKWFSDTRKTPFSDPSDITNFVIYTKLKVKCKMAHTFGATGRTTTY